MGTQVVEAMEMVWTEMWYKFFSACVKASKERGREHEGGWMDGYMEEIKSNKRRWIKCSV